MKQVVKLATCVSILLVLFACSPRIFQANTKALFLPDDAVPNLNVRQPVALKNASLHSGYITLAEWGGGAAKAVGDLDEFTETSIAVAKNVLERRGVEVMSSAVKVLELWVYKPNLEQGVWVAKFSITLKVRTGDGMQMEFVGAKRLIDADAISPTADAAIAQCVKKMLNDQDIIAYLEN